MARHFCGAPGGCLAPCTKVVGAVDEDGSKREWHFCERHFAQLMAEAKERGIPVIDKRVWCAKAGCHEKSQAKVIAFTDDGQDSMYVCDVHADEYARLHGSAGTPVRDTRRRHG